PINRDRAAALGVTAHQVETALYDAYGSGQVSTIYTPTNQYWVVMELLPEYQQDLSALSLLSIRSNNGTLVPLASLATITSSVGPLTVNHAGQVPSVTISFDLKPGVSIGPAVADVQRVARQSLPSSITGSFSGTAQAFQSSQSGLLLLLVLAVFVIYMVLGILYESFIHPLTILSALPFAGFGALLTLLIFRVDLSVYAFVGIIMLVGLVKKNGIMMIDFALEAQRAEGKSAHDAILQACSIRFRPIMMTTMAALMGTLPIALGVGQGSESRRPLGSAVVGGGAVGRGSPGPRAGGAAGGCNYRSARGALTSPHARMAGLARRRSAPIRGRNGRSGVLAPLGRGRLPRRGHRLPGGAGGLHPGSHVRGGDPPPPRPYPSVPAPPPPPPG